MFVEHYNRWLIEHFALLISRVSVWFLITKCVCVCVFECEWAESYLLIVFKCYYATKTCTTTLHRAMIQRQKKKRLEQSLVIRHGKVAWWWHGSRCLCSIDNPNFALQYCCGCCYSRIIFLNRTICVNILNGNCFINNCLTQWEGVRVLVRLSLIAQRQYRMTLSWPTFPTLQSYAEWLR